MSVLDVDRSRIYYDHLGTGGNGTICFIHAIASDGGMWRDQAARLLRSGWSVLRIDLRGHGGSETSPGPYTLEMLGGDIRAVLRASAVERCHFVGLSIGGVLALWLAIHCPDVVQSLFVSNTSPCSTPQSRIAWQQRADAAIEAGSLAAGASGMIGRWVHPSFEQEDAVSWNRMRQGIIATKLESFLAYAALLQDYDLLQGLPSVKCPALVASGGDDMASPPSDGKQIAALIPGAAFHEISGARHFANIGKAAAFNSLLDDWFQTRVETPKNAPH